MKKLHLPTIIIGQKVCLLPPLKEEPSQTKGCLPLPCADTHYENTVWKAQNCVFQTPSGRLWRLEDEKSPHSTLWLLEEARSAASQEINTPHILPCFVDTLSAHLRYRVYESTEYGSLFEWRTRNPHIRAQKLFSITHHVIEALKSLNEQGIVIGHVTPLNTFLSDEGIKFIPLRCVADASMKKVFGSTGSFERNFIAPECEEVKTSEIAQLEMAQIYSVASMLYFLIANQAPPIDRQYTYKPVFGPRYFMPNFPLGWDNVIMKALHPLPSKRFSSLDAFFDALQLRAHVMRNRSLKHSLLYLECAALTDVGDDKRRRGLSNQDAVLLLHHQPKNVCLAAVSDGISRALYGSGGVASETLMRCVQEEWAKLDWDQAFEPAAFLNQCVISANQALCDILNEECQGHFPDLNQTMGCTALLAFLHNGELLLLSTGDSRCYIVRDNDISCLTRDHNYITTRLLAGAPVEDVLVHPQAHALTQCLGSFELTSNPSTPLAPLEPQFDLYKLNLLPGDRILLTTDGLLDIEEEAMAFIVRRHKDPTETVYALIEEANHHGGYDNIGVALIHVSLQEEHS